MNELRYAEAGHPGYPGGVRPACGGAGGNWVCLEHGALRNNLEKSSHSEPRCTLAWWCVDHGVVEAA